MTAYRSLKISLGFFPVRIGWLRNKEERKKYFARGLTRITEARLQHSFPILDMLLRYKLSALEKPDVLSHLRDRMDARQAMILAVDLASQEVVVGYMGQESPASRAVIGGRLVAVPR